MSSNTLQSSLLWKFFERASVQIINFIVQIILARLIEPEQFGYLAIILVFYNISDIFVQKGFGSALIRKKDISKSDIDSTLIVSLLVAILIFILLFIIAPYVGNLYQSFEIINSLRIIALCLLLSPFYCVYNSLLIRNMQFKVIFLRGLFSSIISGCVSVCIAVMGYGLWALVIQIVLNQLLLTLIMTFGVNYRIGFKFSKLSFISVFHFGKNVLLTEILLYLVESVRTIFIGKVYSPAQLAYYDRGQMYPNVAMNAINDTFFSTFLPLFSRNQDNNLYIKEKFKDLTRFVLFITTPFFWGVAAVSSEFVSLVLTDVWLGAVPYIIIFSIYQSIFPYQTICKVVLYSKGDSKKVLNIEIFKSILSLLLMIISLHYGVLYVAISLIVVRLFSIWLYLINLRKHIGSTKIISYTFRPFISAFIMFIVIYNINVIDNIFYEIIIKVILGVLIYCFMQYIIDRKFFKNVVEKINIRSV